MRFDSVYEGEFGLFSLMESNKQYFFRLVMCSLEITCHHSVAVRTERVFADPRWKKLVSNVYVAARNERLFFSEQPVDFSPRAFFDLASKLDIYQEQEQD